MIEVTIVHRAAVHHLREDRHLPCARDVEHRPASLQVRGAGAGFADPVGIGVRGTVHPRWVRLKRVASAHAWAPSSLPVTTTPATLLYSGYWP